MAESRHLSVIVAVRKVLALLLIIAAFSNCNDKEEHYPIEPHIEFVKVQFNGDVQTDVDSLILVFSFTDGDSDFGIDHDDLEYSSDPYHEKSFFQASNNVMDTLTTHAVIGSDGVRYNILDIPDPLRGPLISHRTRNKIGFADLLPVYNCVDYDLLFYRNLLVESDDEWVLDNMASIKETVKIANTTYYQIEDTLLTMINSNYFNFEIEFHSQNGLILQKFDWYKELCNSGFNARIPPNCTKSCGPFEISMSDNYHGEITYSMRSKGFRWLFGGNKMKLKFQIKDRALHRSNTVETPEFFLDDI